MNKNQIIYSSLNKRKQMEFLLSCFAKQKNMFGVPRVILNKKTNFELFFNTPVIFFQKQDSEYFEIIDTESLTNFINDFSIKVIFDTARVNFFTEDNFFKHLNTKTKKLFNLNQREREKEKFIITNLKHYQNQDSIIASIIKNKLNEVWQSKWSVCESYIDDQNAFMNNLQNV